MLLVSEPILGQDERSALSEVVDTGWITMGGRVRQFETAFAAYHGATDAVAVGSCTAALHLILQALGVGPGDEVLVPSLTFVATANAVLYTGATPVFVDIETLDWPLMSRADAATKCTARTKAVIIVHYAGYIAERDAWTEFAARRGLLLIEDAAHAAGAADAGTIGHAAAFSFYGNKNMTTAEGGMVITADRKLMDDVRQLRCHGMTSGTFQRYTSRSVGYDVTMLGFNYRMDEFRAAIGLAQLKRLFQWNEKRRLLTLAYAQALKNRCAAVQLPFLHWQGWTQRNSSHHIMPIVLPADVDCKHVIDRLGRSGIQTSNHYPPIHRLSFYRMRFPGVRAPNTESYAERQLTLPLHPRMEERDVRHVADALAHAVAFRQMEGAA
jgi:dTDP-4-amino-4,6-dideoxygalactose transaminase